MNPSPSSSSAGWSASFFIVFGSSTFSSLIGALLMVYSALALLDRLHMVDSVAWTRKNGPLLNWGLRGVGRRGDSGSISGRAPAEAKSEAGRRPEPEPVVVAPPPPPPAKPALGRIVGLGRKMVSPPCRLENKHHAAIACFACFACHPFRLVAVAAVRGGTTADSLPWREAFASSQPRSEKSDSARPPLPCLMWSWRFTPCWF